MTSVSNVSVPPPFARALAVAIAEVVRFFDRSSTGGPVGVYLVVAPDVGGQLIVGLAATGGCRFVATLEGMASLRRAAGIVRGLGGWFQRGIDGDRMVVGITFEGDASPAAGGEG